MTTPEQILPGGIVSRKLELADIPNLAGFAPAEWHVALDDVLLQHFGRTYFHARVVAGESGIAAVGQGISTGQSGWVGNIIVRPEARNRGLGARITSEVLEALRLQGCSTFLLIATQLGEPVYQKLGFRRTAEYVFLRMPRLQPVSDPCIRRIHPAEEVAVLGLDAMATGEDRGGLLAPHLGSGWGHVGPDGALDGFFLPSLGSGFVMARTNEAGVALLLFKHALYPGTAVIPSANIHAMEFLLRHGAEETARAPRMALGDEAAWRPDFIFGRAAGYCG